MLSSRVLTLILLVLLLVFNYQLWLGKRNYSTLKKMDAQYVQLKSENEVLSVRNQQLRSEIQDLENGGEALEEKARFDLGMIKKGEKFVKYH